MAFTAGSPPGSLCHQVSSNIKKTHLPLGHAHASPTHPPKEIRDSWLLIKLLAIDLPPLLDGFPSMFFELCVRSRGLAGFPGNLRKVYADLKGIGAIKAAAGVDHRQQALFVGAGKARSRPEFTAIRCSNLHRILCIFFLIQCSLVSGVKKHLKLQHKKCFMQTNACFPTLSFTSRCSAQTAHV